MAEPDIDAGVTLRHVFDEIVGDAYDWNDLAFNRIVQGFARAVLTALLTIDDDVVEAACGIEICTDEPGGIVSLREEYRRAITAAINHILTNGETR